MSARPDAAAAPRTRRRSAWFWLATLLLVVAAMEGIAWAGLFLFGGREWLAEQERLAATGLTLEDRGEVEHPFVGIALPPSSTPGDASDSTTSVNALGFPHATPPVQKRSDDRFLVAIAGGSVARHFADQGRRRLMERLSNSPELRGRSIQVICLAIEGFKQPQQLMAVNYILSLGGELDAVVNIDGFNELVVADGNYEVGANTAYPRSWRFATSTHAAGPAIGAQRVQWLRFERQRLAERVQSSWRRYSAIRQLMWRLEDVQLRNEERAAAREPLSPQQIGAWDFRRLGPQEHFADDAELLRRLAALWEDSSRLLQHLAHAEGFIYLHCLQPTAHLPGMKALTVEEQSFVDSQSGRQRQVVLGGYPLLRAAGARRASAGEAFRDFSNLFQSEASTTYVDTCHVNQLGNDLMADRIADELLAILSASGHNAPPHP